MEPIKIPVKAKYLVSGAGKSTGAYRARTGPSCCNGGCGRRKRGVDWSRGTGLGKR